MDEVLKDERFSHIAKDPRFWQMPKKDKKVKIDKRFQAMFSDKKFQVKYSVDKRGRPIDVSSKDNLKRFYDLSDGSDKDESEKKSVSEKKSKKKKDKQIKPEKLGQGNLDSKKTVTKVNKHNKTTDESAIINKKNKKKVTQSDEHDIVSKNKKKGKKQDIEIDMNESEDSDDPEADLDGNKKSDSDNENANNNDNDSDNDSDSANDSEEESDSDYGDSDDELDPSRGIGQEEESSSEEEFEFDADDNFDHNWMELEKDIPEVKDCSNRLAVCNLDWDRMKAADIFMLFNSFKPANGYIQSVSIYPSEFGKERMREEEFEGPKELVEKNDNDVPQTSEEILEGEQFHREKLRQYQINRLRYYYAVIVCDSKDTAIKIYDECDGMEFETSCTKIDLRFIPDDMVFDDEPKSTCTGVSDYKPNYFSNSALGRSQVKLTWDDTDQDRLKVTMTKIDPKKIDDLEKEYENYIASSSDEEEADQCGSNSDNSDTEETRLEKYRQLLQDIDDKKTKKQEEDVEMEITWEPGLKETTQSLVKQSLESDIKVTPWQKFLDKKKEKKKERKKERKQIKEKALMESGVIPEEKDAFSDDEVPEGVDMNDPYFKSEVKDVKKIKKKKKWNKEDLTEEELEKKKQEEAKLALLMMDDEDDSKHFNLEKLVKDAQKKKKNKKKKKMEEDNDKEDDFQVDVEDPRFSALFDSHLFNVDPSAPEFKKTKGSEAFVDEKQKRRKKEGYSKPLKRKMNSDKQLETVTDELQPPTKESISHLVNSVKTKTHKFQNKKKKVS